MSFHCAVCDVPLTQNPSEVGPIYEWAQWDDGEPYCPDHFAELAGTWEPDDDAPRVVDVEVGGYL